MGISNCPLCAGTLIVARIVHSGSAWVLMPADPQTPRQQTSEVYARVCTQCGFVLFFAVEVDRLLRR